MNEKRKTGTNKKNSSEKNSKQCLTEQWSRMGWTYEVIGKTVNGSERVSIG